MATILTKKKDTSGAPSAGDLTNDTGGAELAVNTADKRLYTKDSGGNVVEIGTAPSTIDINAGTIDGTAIGGSTPAAGSFTTLNTSGAVVFNDAGADVDFRVEGDTDANLLFVDAGNDRVGVGTNTPGSILELKAATPLFGINGTTANSARGITFQQNGTTYGSLTLNTNSGEMALSSGENGNAFFLTFKTDTGAEKARIDPSGNLLVGTTSTPSGYSGNIVVGTSGGGFFCNGSSVGNYGTISNQAMVFFTNATERGRFTSGGEFLINATSAIFAGRKIQAKNSGGVAVFKVEGSVGSEVILTWNDATSGNNLFQEFGTEASFTNRGSIDYNRTGGVLRYNTTSDATLKNIIGDSDGAKSVEILNSTRIREFAWKDDEAQKPQIGVIAQELYETFKGAVSIGGDHEETIPAVTEQRLVSEAVLDEDGNELEAAVYETVEVEPERTETKYRPWAVDKTAFTFHLVAGWQAHEKLIKQQAETIAALEARIAALENA